MPQFLLALGIGFGDVGEQVEDTTAVAPLVVVPADELDEVLVERDAGLGVEDGRGGVAVHVRGDDLVLGVGEDSCEFLLALLCSFVYYGMEVERRRTYP